MNIKVISVGKIKEKYIKLGMRSLQKTLKILHIRKHRS